MASVFPFRALRYDPARVRVAETVTQPYDKITPAMQDRYYDLSPYNLVRVILGRRERGDDQVSNVYSRAAAYFRQWRREGVLLQDPEPSIYGYLQHFTLPGETVERQCRRGFVALCQLEDYDAGVVFRHERTLSAPKQDRLELLRALRAHPELIFMLYSDPQQRADELLQASAGGDATELTDEYGVTHRLWRVSDPQAIQTLRASMAEQNLVIADGHHRYETALNYRNERRAQAAHPEPNAPYERVPMAFFNTEAPGLVILPTHRVLSAVAGFQAGEMVRLSRTFFSVEDVSGRFDPQRPTALLPQTGAGETTILVVSGKSVFLFHSKPGASHAALDGLSPRQAELDVVRLHKVVLESVLGITELAIREQKHVEYLRDAREAVTRVREGGADVAFLLNPVGVGQVREMALAGEVLPQKSTDFYPKLLSGLAMYALE